MSVISETQNLVRQLVHLGWRREEIGIEVGVSRRAVTAWQRGESRPNQTHLSELKRLVHSATVGTEGGRRIWPPSAYEQNLPDEPRP